MSEKTNIQWCDASWNVARGCRKKNADCKNCYMYRDSMNDTRYKPNQVTRTKTVFNFPLKYKKTKSDCWDGNPLVFTSSLTDFFIEEIDSYRDEAWDIIRRCPHLVFLILTKRPDRIGDHLPADWGETGYPNVWFGTSVGSENSKEMIIDLIEMKGRCKGIFLSLEPLWDPVNLDENYFPWRLIKNVTKEYRTKLIDLIDWVIVGGESGNEIGKYGYRECRLTYIMDIVKQCKAAKKPVFVKQMGTYLAKQMKYKDRHGGDITEFPGNLQVRQFPQF